VRLVNIGYGNAVVAERVVAIISPDSAPMKRFKEAARKAGRLIDGTQGRRTRSILIVDSHHVVLSALATETVAERLERGGQDDGGIEAGGATSVGRSARAGSDL
jgi:regulator of extracellular matrix RemA (YlzA/DUF370 family)